MILALKPRGLPRFTPMFGCVQHLPGRVNLPQSDESKTVWCRVCHTGPVKGSTLVCMNCHRVAPELAKKVAHDDRRTAEEATKSYQRPKESTYVQPAREGKPVTLTRKEKRALLVGLAGKGRSVAQEWLAGLKTSDLSGTLS